MQLNDKVVVVTGGAQGIGLALCRRFAAEGAKLVIADLDGDRAALAAQELGGSGFSCDVRREVQVRALVDHAIERFGAVDLFCSNAGVMVQDPDGSAFGADDEAWRLSWEVNVMAHVHAARAVVPHMVARGGGYLLQTVSAAGLLHQIGATTYNVSKHAAIGFAESLAISHGDQGIKVSVLCPQYVATAMVGMESGDGGTAPGVITADDVAAAVVRGLADEHFLILPHPQVQGFVQRKAQDYDGWLRGMRKLRQKVVDADGRIDWRKMFSLSAPR